jgi:conjugal transfer pilus assembly protein TraE
MKLPLLQRDLGAARRATTILLALLVGSIAANLVLALFAVRLSGQERIVVIPPSVHKTFWVEQERVSSEYLEQMGYFLMQLVLNVTPQNVDHQSRLLLQYASPSAFGELRTQLSTNAERLKRDSAATVFSAHDLSVDEGSLKVGVRGQLTTFVSDRRVSEVSKGYAIEFQYTGGRLTLKAFRETHPNDPLEAKSTPRAAGSGV